jgi:hypothetical protein
MTTTITTKLAEIREANLNLIAELKEKYKAAKTDEEKDRLAAKINGIIRKVKSSDRAVRDNELDAQGYGAIVVMFKTEDPTKVRLQFRLGRRDVDKLRREAFRENSYISTVGVFAFTNVKKRLEEVDAKLRETFRVEDRDFIVKHPKEICDIIAAVPGVMGYVTYAD